MSSIRRIAASNAVPVDLAKKIGVSGVNEILSVLWQGYHDLKSDTSVSITEQAKEDYITLEWFGKLQQRWYSQNRATCLKCHNISPVHQYPDQTKALAKGYPPTIDFCFRDWNTDDSYFGAEAKNLYDSKPEKIKRYINTGVKNYTNGRYGSQSSESSIVGYVLSGNIPTIVDELKVEIRKESPISNLTRNMAVLEPQYKSCHTRSLDGEKITLHHLFFNFVA
jgi:hypothetical protein